MKCQYTYTDKSNQTWSCGMQPWEKSKDNYCIFHEPRTDKPKLEFNQKLLTQLKGKGNNPRNCFYGYCFCGDNSENQISFKKICFHQPVYFNEAKFYGNTSFKNVIFKNKVIFDKININQKSEILFNNITFKDTVNCNQIQENGMLIFDNTSFFKEVNFENNYFNNFILKNSAFQKSSTIDLVKSHFESITNIANCIFENEVRFYHSTFDGNVYLINNTFEEKTFFQGANFRRQLICENNIFKYPEDQEFICRKARNTWEKVGDKEQADYYFILERRAKRKQLGLSFNNNSLFFKLHKKIEKIFNNFTLLLKKLNLYALGQFIFRFFEWLLADVTTGYGTRWLRLLFWWIFIIGSFGFIYARYNLINTPEVISVSGKDPVGILKGLYFSAVTFFTLGYGDYTPEGEIAQLLASAEAMLGAFFVAAFIAVFSRKFMR